ncbi:type II toxin-antitoxin system VapC family toxin [Novosphingobium sp.]|uniref:type II toxin-antitoxin system VapC family toxin n=1 Tax=Novosphingobium sp. TaxID=1874826 RepID=UPI0025F4E424|nr:type II toxin-antitoxin system VapC family toxin [Novosphingobium sp.]
MAILIDSSVWIDHFRSPIDAIAGQILAGDVRMHRFVIGELALGSLPDRARFLRFLHALPSIPPSDHEALLAFIGEAALDNKGVGFVDAHLLKACADHGLMLWTHDRRLAEQAERLGLLHTA